MRRATSSAWKVGCSPSVTMMRWFFYHAVYFALLGVDRGVTIDLDILKKNYHSFQAQHHPDLHPQHSSDEAGTVSSSSSSAQGDMKDATAYAANAYSVLKDPFQRCRYLRLLLEADTKAIQSGDKELLPTGLDYYKLAVSHDTTEAQKSSQGAEHNKSVKDTVRTQDHDANPVNHDQEFLMEMMELNMKLAETLEHDQDSDIRRRELDSLKETVTKLEEDYSAQCESLYNRIEKLRNEALGLEVGAMGQSAAADVYSVAKNQFRDLVLRWTFASNLKRQIHEGY